MRQRPRPTRRVQIRDHDAVIRSWWSTPDALCDACVTPLVCLSASVSEVCSDTHVKSSWTWRSPYGELPDLGDRKSSLYAGQSAQQRTRIPTATLTVTARDTDRETDRETDRQTSYARLSVCQLRGSLNVRNVAAISL